MGFPSRSVGKKSACNAEDTRDAGLIPGSGRSPGRGNGNPLLAWEIPFMPGKFHGQRSLVGHSPWGRKESDKTEHAHTQRLFKLRILIKSEATLTW